VLLCALELLQICLELGEKLQVSQSDFDQNNAVVLKICQIERDSYLESLQYHTDLDVYEKVFFLLEKYFSLDY